MADDKTRSNPAAPLKTDPRYGYYPWWPEDGDHWVHPEDADLARTLIPSGRVFRREGEQGPFVHLTYGDHQIRVRRTLWKELCWEGIDLGDHVEVRTRGMQHEHRHGVVSAMEWNEQTGQMQYRLSEAGQPVDTWFSRDDLKHVEPTQKQPESRLEPSGDGGDASELELQ